MLGNIQAKRSGTPLEEGGSRKNSDSGKTKLPRVSA
jgi:hypothetical protein